MVLSAGVFGSRMFNARVPSPELITDSNPGYHDNRTMPSPGLKNSTAPWQYRNGDDDPSHVEDHSTAAVTDALLPASSSSQAPPTRAHSTPHDWLPSVTSVSTSWSTSSAAVPESGMSHMAQKAETLAILARILGTRLDQFNQC